MRRPGFPFDIYRCGRAILAAAFVVAGAGTIATLPELFELLPHATQEVMAERFLWSLLVLYWLSLLAGRYRRGHFDLVVIRARRNRVKRPRRLACCCLRVHAALPRGHRNRQRRLAGVGTPISGTADRIHRRPRR